jgi:hypothetical protein
MKGANGKKSTVVLLPTIRNSTFRGINLTSGAARIIPTAV